MCLSSDCGLQLDHMKLESLVIAHQPWRGEYVPGPCTHRPSSHGSWEDLKTYTARMCLGLNQRLGLSRNKVAVPEGVAGTPPFWSVSLCSSKCLLSVHLLKRIKRIKIEILKITDQVAGLMIYEIRLDICLLKCKS